MGDGLGLDAWWDRQAEGRAGRRLPRRPPGSGGHDPVRVGDHPHPPSAVHRERV